MKTNIKKTFSAIIVLSVVSLVAASCSSSANVSTNNSAAKTPVKAATAAPNAPAGANPPNYSGSAAALVTVEEFADFQCGSCASVHPTMSEVKSMYGSRIKFVFRNYPLAIPAHDKAYDAAVAVEAAGMQGKFWDLQNLLFQNQAGWSTSSSYKQTWREYANRIGLDVDRWETDMAGLAAKMRVDADIARGKALGVSSTPTVYINNVQVPFAEVTQQGMKTLIDAELQKAAPQVAPASNSAPANSTNQNK